MFAQLGDHIFQGLKTPTSFSESDAVKYGQNARVNNKPRLQPTGTELREIRLSIQYSIDFCEPITEIEALKKSMLDFEVLPYITGDGRILGKFVITGIETTNQRCAADGRVEMATINISLLESVDGPDPEPIGEALASENPITEPPVEPEVVPESPADIAADIAEAGSKVNGIKNTISKIKGRVTEIKRGVREVRQLANDAKNLYNSAKTKIETAKKIIERAKQLPASLSEAIRYAENLAGISNLIDMATLEMYVGQLSDSADQVMKDAAPVAGFVGTKEGGK